MNKKETKRTIVVKVTEAQYKIIKEKAKREFLQIATWIRKEILENV